MFDRLHDIGWELLQEVRSIPLLAFNEVLKNSGKILSRDRLRCLVPFEERVDVRGEGLRAEPLSNKFLEGRHRLFDHGLLSRLPVDKFVVGEGHVRSEPNLRAQPVERQVEFEGPVSGNEGLNLLA